MINNRIVLDIRIWQTHALFQINYLTFLRVVIFWENLVSMLITDGKSLIAAMLSNITDLLVGLSCLQRVVYLYDW